MKTILTAIYNLFAGMSPAVRVFLGIGSIAIAVNHYVNSLWMDLFGRIDAMAASSTGMADFSPLGLVNYVFPLDTMLSFVIAYGTLRTVCASIRIVKSFIPTIS